MSNIKELKKEENTGKQIEEKGITTSEFDVIQKAFAISSEKVYKDVRFKAALLQIEIKLASLIILSEEEKSKVVELSKVKSEDK